jgi:multicomponent K+:H+ antiporter subunit D
LLAYLVVVSVGTPSSGLSAPSKPGGFFVATWHKHLGSWRLFLLADLIARQRGGKQTLLVYKAALQNPHLLGSVLFGAIAVAGLPPLSGFIGKLLLLRSL